MPDDRNESCDARISSHLEGREEQLSSLFDRLDADGDDEDAQDELYELPLAVETKTILVVQLSTGGPGDWIEAEIDRAAGWWEVQNVTYHFNDWFDHAERPVRDGSPLWRYAELMAGGLE